MNELIKKHATKPQDKATQKENAERAEQFRNELASNGQIFMPEKPTTPKRGPGRPKGSTSKSPKRDEPPKAPSTAEEVAERLRRKKLVAKLRAYRKHFGHILGSDLDGFNPHQCSITQLQIVIDSCKQAITDEVESSIGPDFIHNALYSAEDAVVNFGIVSNDPAAKHLMYLKGFAQTALSNQAIATDLKLIGIEMMGFVPSNPYVRLGMNFAQVGYGVYLANRQNEMLAARAEDPKFDEL